MKSCDPDSGERYVAGLLSEAEESAFVEHLNSCASCQAALESAAGDDEAWQSARELLVWSCAESRPDAAEIAEHHVLNGDPPSIDRSALSFLAPADDPAMIGRIGGYEIMGVLGRGGFGIVLRGHDRALNRNVAIKVLDPAAASVGAARDRFAREARAMAAISHEHVVPVYAVDNHAGLPYFVMAYVPGGSLERRLSIGGRVDAISTVRIGVQIAQALAAAHRQGLVHRDIKPGNVLIDQGTERVYVADFGLARVAGEVSSTRSGFLAGTPQYMAPEQVRGETCDGQSDLFSLGAVLYALCTGHAPFRAETVYGIMQRIVHDAPRPIREQNPLVHEWLERFVLKLLEKPKHHRFSSADEVALALEQELAHLQNPTAVPEPVRSWSGIPATKPNRKSRRVLYAGCALLAIFVALRVSFPPDASQAVDSNAPRAKRATQPAGDLIPGATGVPASETFPPLWELDGTRELREAADRFEAQWHASTAGPDPWSQQAVEARRRLQRLAIELEPPARGTGIGNGARARNR